MISRASPWTPTTDQPAGDYREDKKRRLLQGHTGELSSSRSAHEDLDDMFASLSIDSVLAQENSGERPKDRKRKSCQENAGNLTNALPDDVLENMFASLAIQNSRVASTASTRSGKGSVIILDDKILVEGDSDCTTCTDSRSEVFIERVNELLRRHDGTGVRVFEVYFELNSTHAAHLDKWVQFASEAGAQDVMLSLCKNMTSCPEHLVTANRYNFPLHCFGDGRQRSSMQQLDLTNCIFMPPLDSSAFSSLVRLLLERVTITDSGIQNICSSCPILCFLRLARCDDLVNVRISHEELICLDIFRCNKLASVEIHATGLLIFEYDGREVHINYASTPNMRTLVNKFGNRNGYLSDGVEAMERIKKITLTFLSPSEKHGFILYAVKFPAVQFIDLSILPSWHNVLAVSYLLKATPCIKRLRLEARGGDQHYPDGVEVNWPQGVSLKRLRFITVGGYAGQAPLVELLAFLVHEGTRSRRTCLKIDPRHHLWKGLGRWLREDVGDKLARDRARKAAEETLRSRLSSRVNLVMK
uniref:At1g61320/AtMIF1 LRR domain-containing protein n=1 Tax=Hordeum vulgare subsp. vulgare TaxID=112509 RepID=A0A8I6XU16_HORVV